MNELVLQCLGGICEDGLVHPLFLLSHVVVDSPFHGARTESLLTAEVKAVQRAKNVLFELHKHKNKYFLQKLLWLCLALSVHGSSRSPDI